MTLPPSRLRRTALVVLLSCDREVLLLPVGGGRGWQPVRLEVPVDDSYLSVVGRWQSEALPPGSVRRGLVTGHLSVASTAAGAVVREDFRLFILRLCTSWDGAKGIPSARWWPIAELREPSISLFPHELGVLMEGYVDGWIPDGPITLDG